MDLASHLYRVVQGVNGVATVVLRAVTLQLALVGVAWHVRACQQVMMPVLHSDTTTILATLQGRKVVLLTAATPLITGVTLSTSHPLVPGELVVSLLRTVLGVDIE